MASKIYDFSLIQLLWNAHVHAMTTHNAAQRDPRRARGARSTSRQTPAHFAHMSGCAQFGSQD